MSWAEELRRRIEFEGPVHLGIAKDKWGVQLRATLRITTPEQEPAVIFVTVEAQLRSMPTNPDDELGDWIVALLADRLGGPIPAPDPPIDG
jgi:hypothetical protein